MLERPSPSGSKKNRVATLRRDREEIAKVALEFDGYIRQSARRAPRGCRNRQAKDVTAELLTDIVDLPGEEPPHHDRRRDRQPHP